MHRASPAEPGAAAEFRSCKFERISQNPEQRSFRRNVYFFFAAIYPQSEFGHMFFRNKYHLVTILLSPLKKWNEFLPSAI